MTIQDIKGERDHVTALNMLGGCLKTIIFILFSLLVFNVRASDYCGEENGCTSSSTTYKNHWTHSSHRYLLYEVNPGEGFNLRRDVYMRVASLVRIMNIESSPSKWVLVLPPWGPLYHWKSKEIGYQAQIKWSKFFDSQSLSSYVPVIELEDFLTDHGSDIDMVYYLQHYAEGWADNTWTERVDARDCIETPPYDHEDGIFFGWFWGYENIKTTNFQCLSVQGYSSTLKNYLLSSNYSVVMIDRAEVILHDSFGDSDYWKVRQSMQFSKHLMEIADKYRKKHLNSSSGDIADYPLRLKRKSVGGPYMSVHLRRADFALSRSSEVPSIKHAAKQILSKMKQLDLNILFVATDASAKEFSEIKTYIPSAKRYVPSKEVLEDILDGGMAIVDQLICAYSRYFIGTHESTFSFRIQEEREILGFPIETTFNRLCGDNHTTCSQPSKWKIVWS